MTSMNIGSRNLGSLLRGIQGPLGQGLQRGGQVSQQGVGNSAPVGPGRGGPEQFGPGSAGQSQFGQARFRDSFESGSSTNKGGIDGVSQAGGAPRLSGQVLDQALRAAGVTPEQHRSVMQAVKDGATSGKDVGQVLDNALKQAGVTPEQHHQVMEGARNPRGASATGSESFDSGSGDLSSDNATGGQQLKAQALDQALRGAGLSPEQHHAVMQAVKDGATSGKSVGEVLSAALKDAGVSDEQHHQVMDGVRRSGASTGSSTDKDAPAIDPSMLAQISTNRLTSSLSSF